MGKCGDTAMAKYTTFAPQPSITPRPCTSPPFPLVPDMPSHLSTTLSFHEDLKIYHFWVSDSSVRSSDLRFNFVHTLRCGRSHTWPHGTQSVVRPARGGRQNTVAQNFQVVQQCEVAWCTRITFLGDSLIHYVRWMEK